jgi:hypothetical protein
MIPSQTHTVPNWSFAQDVLFYVDMLQPAEEEKVMMV